MPAFVTNRLRVLNALNLVNSSNVFVGLGGSQPWEDDQFPPIPDGSELALLDPIIYRKATEVAFAKPDPNGVIEYSGARFSITQDPDVAISDEYSWVFVRAEIYKGEAPVGVEFRQVGVFVDCEATTDEDGYSYPDTVEGAPNLMMDSGDMIVIDNRRPVTRHDDQIESIEVIIEM